MHDVARAYRGSYTRVVANMSNPGNSLWVRAAAVVAALSAAVWPAALLSLLILRHDRHLSAGGSLTQHPTALIVGFATSVAFGISAWRIEADDWKGTLFPTVYYTFGLIATGTSITGGSVRAWVAMLELLVMLAALYQLRPRPPIDIREEG